MRSVRSSAGERGCLARRDCCWSDDLIPPSHPPAARCDQNIGDNWPPQPEELCNLDRRPSEGQLHPRALVPQTVWRAERLLKVIRTLKLQVERLCVSGVSLSFEVLGFSAEVPEWI